MRKRVHTVVTVTVIIILIGLIAWINFAGRSTPIPTLYREARIALLQRDFDRCENLCKQVLRQDPDHEATLLLAGESAMRSTRYEDALNYFQAITESSTEESIKGQFACAEVLRALGRISEAEAGYRKIITRQPQHAEAHERLAFILDFTGRRWEAIPHLLQQLRHDRISFSFLIRMGSRDSAVPFPEELERIRQSGHDTWAVSLAEAAGAAADLRPEEVEARLKQVIKERPALVEPYARLGLWLADHDVARIPEWQRQLPPHANLHPDIHTAMGLWCLDTGQKPAAVRCLLEAARLDPSHRLAHYQLAKLLTATEFSERPSVSETAVRCADRARLLQELAAEMNRLTLNRSDLSAMNKASELLEQLGRYWEAYGWCGLILTADPRRDAVRQRMQSLSRKLDPAMDMTAETAIAVSEVDLTDYPQPVWPDATIVQQNLLPTDPDRGVRFVESAADAGLVFTYFHGRNQVTPGTLMYEFAGGGVAAFDYDADGSPDVYLTQGCRWPPDSESTEYRDVLFRNQEGRRFRNVTEDANLGDGWFSQGVAVGDLNNDGFPDLYVANIGQNTLYINNGDGTFEEVSEPFAPHGTEWTTSCLMADLDGDSFPDLYDVNYLQGNDLFERLCSVGGQLRACVPGEFQAEIDRIHINRQNGEFAELSGERAKFLEPARPGLGVIAADTDGSGRLSLFVANDVTANAFLINETSRDDNELWFREAALPAGLAFDRDGKAQACMGVAADDADGNGLIDILVTNYHNESNSLYLQLSPGSFFESSRAAGLYDVSLPELGFGTQFIDAELDGASDLIVANGHLDDFTYMDIPHRMQPQFFSNDGSGHFAHSSASSGPYFQRQLLGRSVAVLDWNTDGRPDCAVTHIETPVALLTNETESHGHWLKLRLRGTKSSRDAGGCRVTVICGQREWTRQLTLGSGYLAANESMLLFGVGDCTLIDRLTVWWPSGETRSFEHVATDREFALVEGRKQPLELPPKH